MLLSRALLLAAILLAVQEAGDLGPWHLGQEHSILNGNL